MSDDDIVFIKGLCLAGAALFFLRLMFDLGRLIAWELYD